MAMTKEQALAMASARLRMSQQGAQEPQAQQPQPKTMADISPFDQNVVERGDVFYPYGKTASGEEVLAWPNIVKDVVEGALMPGHLAQGGAATTEEMQGAAQAIVPSSRGLIGGVKPKMRPQTAKEVKAPASKIYKSLENTPTQLDASQSSGLLSGLEARLDAEAITPKGYPKVWSALRDMKRYEGREMPMKRLMAHLRILNKDVTPDEKRVADIMSGYIKNYVAKNGGPEASGDIALLNKADQLWAKGSTTQEFQNAIETAKHAKSGFENGLRDEFAKILRKEIKGKVYLQPEVKIAIEKVVDGTIPANLLRRIGKFGPGIGQQTNGLMAMLLAMSGGGAYALGSPGMAAGVAGLAAAGTAAQMGSRAATRGAAQSALGKQAGMTQTGQYATPPNIPMMAAPRVLGTQVQEGPQGLLYDEKGPFL